MAIYYLFLLSNPGDIDKAFDNMLLHLLRGEFTSIARAIGYEAFTRDDKTYAYFGIFPVVLYMPAGILLWLVPRPTRVPVAHSEAAEARVPMP